MPIERVLLPLVHVEFLDVLAVPHGAEPADVRRRHGIGMHSRDEQPVIRDVTVRDVARPEVVRDPDAEFVRRDDDPPGRGLFAGRGLGAGGGLGRRGGIGGDISGQE